MELPPEPERPPEPELEPEAAFEPKHVPEFSAGVEEELADVSSELEPLPEYIVDPATTPEPAALTPEPVSALEPEPDPGPLPDYIVDPTKPRPPVLKTPKPERRRRSRLSLKRSSILLHRPTSRRWRGSDSRR